MEGEEDILDDEEERAYKPPPPFKKCNQRLDELATPQRRMYLALWNEHAYHFPEEKVNNLKELLQRLYAMSPEETAKYFAELKSRSRAAARRRRLKERLRKYLSKKHHQKQRARAYKMFLKMLKFGLRYAFENPVAPLVSIRLRYLSDIILEQLCDLRSIEVPERSNPDLQGHIMISVSDWIAIAVEHLYYAAQLSINNVEGEDEISADENYMMQSVVQEQKLQDYGLFQPPASSTPRSSVQQEPGSRRSSKMSGSLASSTKRGSQLKTSPTRKTSMTRRGTADSGFTEMDVTIGPDPYYSIIEKKGSSKRGDQKKRFFNPQQIKQLKTILDEDVSSKKAKKGNKTKKRSKTRTMSAKSNYGEKTGGNSATK